jgi:hypothetical protein
MEYGVIQCAGRIFEVVFVHDRDCRGDTLEYDGQRATIVGIFSNQAEAQAWAKAQERRI